MFLDSVSRKVLNYLIHTTPNMDDGLFTLDNIAKNCGLNEEETRVCLLYLEQLGLVMPVEIDWPTTISKKLLWGYFTTHRGRHYMEFQRIELFASLVKSVLLPILVSLVTALLIV